MQKMQNEEIDKSGRKIKKFDLSKDEREKIQNIQSVIGILSLQREGLNNSMYVEIARVRARVGIDPSKAPEGFNRMVDFDAVNYKLLVIDTPIPEKVENVAKQLNEAKN